MSSTIRIDELDPTVNPHVGHEFAAMKDGITVKLSVQQVVNLAKLAIVGSAPEALDTLDELAAALSDDANFAASVTTSLAGKQPLDSLLTSISTLTVTAGKFQAFSGSDAAEARDIVGTVSQSSGTPTGAIIEQGSNSNGEYVRFADGTQICFGINIPSSNSNNGTTFTFPAAFSATPIVVATAGFTSSGSNGSSYVVETSTPTTTSVKLKVLSHAVSNIYANGNIPINFIAMGRWF